MSKNAQQRPVIHPKLRGKLENWQRNQVLAAGEDQRIHDEIKTGGDVTMGETAGRGCSVVVNAVYTVCDGLRRARSDRSLDT